MNFETWLESKKNWIKDAVSKPGALKKAAKRKKKSVASYCKNPPSGKAEKRCNLMNTLKKLGESSEGEQLKHYMFFSNLVVIKQRIDELISMDRHELDAMLEDGHDWAADHIATSKDDIEEVYNWATSRGSEF